MYKHSKKCFLAAIAAATILCTGCAGKMPNDEEATVKTDVVATATTEAETTSETPIAKNEFEAEEVLHYSAREDIFNLTEQNGGKILGAEVRNLYVDRGDHLDKITARLTSLITSDGFNFCLEESNGAPLMEYSFSSENRHIGLSDQFMAVKSYGDVWIGSKTASFALLLDDEHDLAVHLWQEKELVGSWTIPDAGNTGYMLVGDEAGLYLTTNSSAWLLKDDGTTKQIANIEPCYKKPIVISARVNQSTPYFTFGSYLEGDKLYILPYGDSEFREVEGNYKYCFGNFVINDKNVGYFLDRDGNPTDESCKVDAEALEEFPVSISEETIMKLGLSEAMADTLIEEFNAFEKRVTPRVHPSLPKEYECPPVISNIEGGANGEALCAYARIANSIDLSSFRVFSNEYASDYACYKNEDDWSLFSRETEWSSLKTYLEFGEEIGEFVKEHEDGLAFNCGDGYLLTAKSPARIWRFCDGHGNTTQWTFEKNDRRLCLITNDRAEMTPDGDIILPILNEEESFLLKPNGEWELDNTPGQNPNVEPDTEIEGGYKLVFAVGKGYRII